jgi:uncharacterized membrane protein YdbT with pleckstrin-like domain
MWERLGLRSFVIYVIQGFLPGLFLFILAFVILLIKNYLPTSTGGAAILGSSNITAIVSSVAGFFVIAAFPLMGLGIIINIIRYFSFGYRLDDEALRFRRGIISVDEISILYHNIQDVDLDQSVLGRIFGIAELYVITAGRGEPNERAETEATFHVMDVGKARDLQRTLLDRGSVQKVKAV